MSYSYIRGKQIKRGEIEYEHLSSLAIEKIYNLRKELCARIINNLVVNNTTEHFEITENVYKTSFLPYYTSDFSRAGTLLTSNNIILIDGYINRERYIGKGEISGNIYINGLELYKVWFRDQNTHLAVGSGIASNREVFGELYCKEYSCDILGEEEKIQVISNNNYAIINNPRREKDFYKNKIVCSWNGSDNIDLSHTDLGYIVDVEDFGNNRYKVIFSEPSSSTYFGFFRLYQYYFKPATYTIINNEEKFIPFTFQTETLISILYIEIQPSYFILPTAKNYYDFVDFYKITNTSVIYPNLQIFTEYFFKTSDILEEKPNSIIFKTPLYLEGTTRLYIDGVRIFKGIPSNSERRYLELSPTQDYGRIQLFNVSSENLATEEIIIEYIANN